MDLPEKLEEYIQLYLYDELSEAEKQAFETYLESHEEGREQLEQWRWFHGLLEHKAQPEPSEDELLLARLDLRDRLRSERRAEHSAGFWQKVSAGMAMRPLPRFVPALVFVLTGVLLGQFTPFVFRMWQDPTPALAPPALAEEAFISDVDLIEYEPRSGSVTVHYKVLRGVALQGNIESPRIRNVLSHAIRAESNPGRRLTAIKASGGASFVDKELETALIYALEKDEIDGVRLRAVQALSRQPISETAKRAFVRVLMKDPNPAVRIEALEVLSQMREAEVASVLQNASRIDENEFVRLRAARALQRTENPNWRDRVTE